MVQLLPGVSAQHTIEIVEDASREAGNVLGRTYTGIDLLNAYREWSNNQTRMLGSVLVSRSLEFLVLTRRYWMLQELDPAAYGNSLASVVSLELSSATRRLDEAAAALKLRRDSWSTFMQGGAISGKRHAIVLDTNVLLRHYSELASVEWNLPLNVRPHEAITLGIPIAVVEELDSLKLSNASMNIRGVKHATRTLARHALKVLDELFPAQWHRSDLRLSGPDENGINGELHAVLMIDDLDHVRLPDTDAEIIDRARELTAFATTVAVASYDNALLFRARNEGLNAFKPENDLEEQ